MPFVDGHHGIYMEHLPYKAIFLTGVDGAGKTFLTHKLLQRFNATDQKVVYAWSRFNNYFSKPLLALTRLIGLNYYETHGDVKIGYHCFEKNRLIAVMFTGLQLLDVWIATIWKFWVPIHLKKRMVVADRGPFDTLIDVMVDTKNAALGATLTGRLFTCLIPKPYLLILVVRDKERAIIDRPDLVYDRNYDLKVSLYKAYIHHFGGLLIDNNGSPQESMRQLLQHLGQL